MGWLKIERYLGRTVIVHTLVVLAVLLVVLGFVELSIQLGKLTQDYTLEKGLLYTLLKLPVYGYEVFPVALLIGTLMGLGGLAARSELTILRASGWSVGRIFVGVLKSVLLFALLMAAIGEYVGPPSEVWAKKLRAEALHRDFSIGAREGFWLRQKGPQGGNWLVHVRSVTNAHTLVGLTLYRVEQGRPVAWMQARKAIWDEPRRKWRLQAPRMEHVLLVPARAAPPADWARQVPTTRLRIERTQLKDQFLALNLRPDMLTVMQVDTRYMGIRDLVNQIRFLEANGLDSSPYRLALWRKAVLPLTLLAMVAVVFPLVFGSIRQSSMGQRIFIGVLLGLGYHYLSQVSGNMALVYGLPLWLGVLIPPLLLGGIGLYGIWRMDHPRVPRVRR